MDILQLLRNSRSVIAGLLDKAWELGGYCVGEDEFESYDFVKDARSQLVDLESAISELTTKQKTT